MKAEIINGNLVITIPVAADPVPSKSGKSLLVATTGGNQKTAVQFKGQPLVVSVNAYVAR